MLIIFTQDKILQSSGHQETVQVTNDGATILKSIGVDNPAAKVLVGRYFPVAKKNNEFWNLVSHVSFFNTSQYNWFGFFAYIYNFYSYLYLYRNIQSPRWWSWWWNYICYCVGMWTSEGSLENQLNDANQYVLCTLWNEKISFNLNYWLIKLIIEEETL